MSISVMSGPIDHDDLVALPPAPTAVYRALREAEADEMTKQELAGETLMKPRTVRDALHRLVKDGLIETRWHNEDARTRTYRIAEDGGER
ncbi:Transcriptional regulator PadR-like family protein [Halopenitus malekzadehii]|uniref:Transcriptional regulator PadR-like family protein n=1 Tax=Halopenitus malekzadehii TaxID=1267564 RepID=A0A1H6JLT6_9EURY|nr:helix-turn-helix transcriptional regulator [Halopenitus malekzadehii]SEH60730.1 Transcriptional regulator PadR-like family protein [Halopenitus malekzadehii]